MNTILCLSDSYVKELENATITKIEGNNVFLDKTVFYPQGGGQPGDTGFIYTSNNDKIRVTNTKKLNGEAVHVLDQALPETMVGETVRLVVDWDRRYVFMRYHTALHILTAIVYREWKALVTGGNISLERARLDFDLDKLDQERKQYLEEQLNQEIQKDYSVKVYWLPRDEAEKIPALIRLKVNLLPSSLKTLRIVEIQGLDIQADGGLHVKRTSEIGHVIIQKVENKGKGRKRVHIKLQ